MFCLALWKWIYVLHVVIWSLGPLFSCSYSTCHKAHNKDPAVRSVICIARQFQLIDRCTSGLAQGSLTIQ